MLFHRCSDITGLSCQTADRHLIKGTLQGCFSLLCLEPCPFHFTGSRSIWSAKLCYFMFINGPCNWQEWITLRASLNDHLFENKDVSCFCCIFLNRQIPILVNELLSSPSHFDLSHISMSLYHNTKISRMTWRHGWGTLPRTPSKLEDSHEKPSKKPVSCGFSWTLWSSIHDLN